MVKETKRNREEEREINVIKREKKKKVKPRRIWTKLSPESKSKRRKNQARYSHLVKQPRLVMHPHMLQQLHIARQSHCLKDLIFCGRGFLTWEHLVPQACMRCPRQFDVLSGLLFFSIEPKKVLFVAKLDKK